MCVRIQTQNNFYVGKYVFVCVCSYILFARCVLAIFIVLHKKFVFEEAHMLICKGESVYAYVNTTRLTSGPRIVTANTNTTAPAVIRYALRDTQPSAIDHFGNILYFYGFNSISPLIVVVLRVSVFAPHIISRRVGNTQSTVSPLRLFHLIVRLIALVCVFVCVQ